MFVIESGGSVLEKKPSQEAGRVLPAALFVVYLVLLAWTVLWKLQAPHIGAGALHHIKLVPFIPGEGSGASTPFEAVFNVFLFVPFGLYLGLLSPRWPWWRVAGAIAGASLVLEVSQYALAIGSSDATDLVTNTAGGMAGFGLFVLAQRRFRERTARVVIRACSIGTAFALIAGGLFMASPVRYAQPRDERGATMHPRSPQDAGGQRMLNATGATMPAGVEPRPSATRPEPASR